MQNLRNQYSCRNLYEKMNFNICYHLPVTFFTVIQSLETECDFNVGDHYIEVKFSAADEFYWPIFILHLKQYFVILMLGNKFLLLNLAINK